MICNQTSICLPNSGPLINGSNALCGRSSLSLSQSRYLHVSSLSSCRTPKFQYYKSSSRLVYRESDFKRCTPVCASGGKGNSDSVNEAFSWDSLKKAMGNLGKEQSLENMLKKQIQERELNGDGSGGSPPGGAGDGSGGSEDGDFGEVMDELLQVIMATLGFIFVYIYLIRGEELTRLAKDYIKFLFGAKKSMRLDRAMYKWRRFYERITWTPPREDWLERAIISTPTWWHKPEKLAHMMESPDSVKPYEDDS